VPHVFTAWALRGQVKVWLDPDNRDAGRSDFAAAAKLDSASGTWVVPYRMEREDFEAKVKEVVGSSGIRTKEEWLPEASMVENGLDPDTPWYGAAVPDSTPRNSVFPLGPEWNPNTETASQLLSGTTFVLYQRNIENLSNDEETVRKEIQESLTEIIHRANNLRARIADKTPEEHAENADAPEDENR
jgi:hypothetical protein